MSSKKCVINGTLPIELLYIRGEALNKNNKITWASSTETNTQHHVIERSINGSDEWIEIGRTNVAGSSFETIDYEFIDVSPIIFAYYRLKTIDFDGSTQVSKVLVLKRENKNLEVISVYPIPNSEVYVNLDSKSTVSLTLTDVSGRILTVDHYEANSAVNQLSLDLSAFNAGVYYLQIDNGNQQTVRRIVKQ